MGAWGPGILQDDVAADVRLMFDDGLSEGMSVYAATLNVLEHAPWPLDDVDDSSVTYLALAALQLQRGQLEPAIRDRAVETIISGAALARCEGGPPEVVAERAGVLAQFKAILERGSCTSDELERILE